MLSRLLYRDGMMLVIDKPAGLSVHRGPKGGASLEDYFDVLRFGLPRMPALAHRLDKDTSGCLVLGRHRKALALLGKLFKQGKIGKTYWAVVEGSPDADEGLIDMPLGRLDETRGWWMTGPRRQAFADDMESDGTVYLSLPRRGRAARRSASEGERRLRRHPPLSGEGQKKDHLARARAADRPHASNPRALRRDGLAGAGR